MKKSISSLLLLSMAFAPSVYGWGVKNGESQLPPDESKMGGVNNPGIHLHGDEENGYLKFSYLLFRPHLDDTTFTTKVVDSLNTTPSSEKVTPKSIHFDWSSGARVNIGMYLPHYDLWDIGFITTYLYSDAENELSVPNIPSAITQTYLAPQLYQSVLGDFSTEASGNWRMNFFTYDLGLAREYFLTPKITARPYLGVRGLTIYQKFSVKYRSFFVNASGVAQTPPVNTRFSQTQDTWGVGVKAATDLTFELPSNFSIFGNIGGSLLYGHFNSKQKVSNGQIHPLPQPYNPVISQHAYDLQTGLEGTIGFKWEHWYPENNNRITLSFAFEAQHWFDMNKWTRVDVTDLTTVLPAPFTGTAEIPVPNATQLHGDLTFMGLTFALQWDF